MFDDNKQKADFGVSVLLEKEGEDVLNSKFSGTYHFTCPESGKNNEFSSGYSGKRADIWALGVTLFAFTYNTVPFDGDTVLEILNAIENKE